MNAGATPQTPQDSSGIEELRKSIYGCAFAVETHPKDFVLRINEKGMEELLAVVEAYTRQQTEQSFEYGIIEGTARTIANIKDRATDFKIENQCYVIPVEQVDTLGDSPASSHPDDVILKERFKRWHVFSRIGNATLYVAVTPQNSSYVVTIEDGRMKSQAFLGDNVPDALQSQEGAA